MKKKLINLLFIPLFLIGLMFGNTSCKDETDCKMEIEARLFSDNNVVIPNAKVYIYQHDVKIHGVTNGAGKFEYTYPLEAILNITITDSVVIDTTVTPPISQQRIGEGTIRLKAGELVKKIIYVK